MTSPAPRKTKAPQEEDAAAAPPEDVEEVTPDEVDVEEVTPDAVEEAVPDEVPLPDKAAEYLALAQRTQADFENFRKRMARESATAIDRGVRKLAKELLPALDHLELALQAAEAHEGGAEWAKGIRQVQDEFVSALGRVGIQPFAPVGEPFDPAEHEAMAELAAEGFESGTVVSVYQQGYRHNGQVLRPARVVVAP